MGWGHQEGRIQRAPKQKNPPFYRRPVQGALVTSIHWVRPGMGREHLGTQTESSGMRLRSVGSTPARVQPLDTDTYPG